MIRFVFSALFMIAGLAMFTTSVVGNFRFSYILNRMQSSSLCDTFGTLLIVISLIIRNGWDITTAKLILMVAFLWFANPVSAHFLAKTEVISDDDIKEKCEVVHHDHI